MRAGGIFGGGALGLGATIDLSKVDGASLACSMARSLGSADAARKKAFDTYGIRVKLGLSEWSTAEELAKVAECYRQGYYSESGRSCEAARTLGVADRKAGRGLDTTGLVARVSGNVQDVVLIVDCYKAGYNETSLPNQPAPPVDPGDGGGSGTRAVFSGGACTSSAAIEYVQGAIGVTVDGKWGPASQAALTASGKKFADIASGCSGNVPYYGGSGGGALTTIPPTVTPPKEPMLSSMGNFTSSPVFWAILLAAGVGGYFYMSKPKRGSKGSKR